VKASSQRKRGPFFSFPLSPTCRYRIKERPLRASHPPGKIANPAPPWCPFHPLNIPGNEHEPAHHKKTTPA